MQSAEKELLFTEINKLACSACRLMTDVEREDYFVYQEGRRLSNEALKTKYTVPVRTYYKGKNVGELKTVYEVEGVAFEKLWDKLYKYAIKSAMGSHQSNHYNNPDVQNDVCDIRYQTFYVLRYFGPTPSSKLRTYAFSEFFILIVNNILTTSARRRGVYREVSDFLPWFDENRNDDFYFDSYCVYLEESNEELTTFMEFMFRFYVHKYHSKNEAAILEARAKYDNYVEKALAEISQGCKKKHLTIKPFYFNVGNCESTMVNYKADSIYDEFVSDADEPKYYADILEDRGAFPPDTDIIVRELFDSCAHAFDIRILDDVNMHKPIKRLIKGESLTKVAKSLNVKVEELREALRGILPSLQ